VTGFRFLAAAETELYRQIEYDSAIRPELGAKFALAVDSAVRLAVAHPDHGSMRSKSTRRRLVKGFPFGVVYAVVDGGVLIVAIAHLRKKPEYWAGRFKDVGMEP